MDALSALSVAASVAQFIEFGYSLVTKSKEIYGSAYGASLQQVETELATKRLIELSGRIKESRSRENCSQFSAGEAEEDRALETICDSCILVSNELLSRLDALRVMNGQKSRRYKSFRQALKSVWSKAAVDKLAERLKSFSGRVGRSYTRITESFNSFDKTLRHSIKTFLQYLIDIQEKISRVVAIQDMDLDLKQREGFINLHRDELAAAAKKREQENKVIDDLLLQELRFSTMTHRQLEITEAHQRTFSWIFESTGDAQGSCNDFFGERRPWSSFVEWLKEDSQTYWINGKAGSGKSTLMRYICSKPETFNHLMSWSGELKLQVARFYFWNSGSEEQRSQLGLLRSLLYDLLKERKDLIRLVLEEEWDYLHSRRSRGVGLGTTWSFARLEQAFHEVSSFTSNTARICLFIDGLDEYEGESEALMGLLQRVSQLSRIKMCVSSRPGIVFEEVFDSCPGLRLQDLTCPDIQIYVRDELESHQRMRRLATVNPYGAASLAKKIVTKANGVFLWVRLVTYSLLNGLRNRDNISDLQRRLEALPSDLDALYDHMIRRIDPLYIQQACRILQIYDCATDLSLRPTVLELELAASADYSQMMVPGNKTMSDLEIEDRCDRMTAHLKSRCQGLLEVHDILDRHWESTTEEVEEEVVLSSANLALIPEDIQEEGEAEKRLRVFWKVSYLHRTVKDYLKADVVRAKLQSHNPSTLESDPHMVLLMSYVLNYKNSLHSFYLASEMSEVDRIWKTTSDVLMITERIADHNDKSRAVLHEFYELAYQWWKKCSFYVRGVAADWRTEFLSLVAYFGLSEYIDDYLGSDQVLPYASDGTSLLCYALGVSAPQSHRDIRIAQHRVQPLMVALLLRRGLNPNDAWGPFTVWHATLQLIESEMFTYAKDGLLRRWVRTLHVMLQYDADPFPCNTSCQELQHPTGTLLSVDLIVDKFLMRVPPEAAVLRTYLEERKSEISGKRKLENFEDSEPRKRLQTANPEDG